MVVTFYALPTVGAVAGALGPVAAATAKAAGASKATATYVSVMTDTVGQPVIGVVSEQVITGEKTSTADKAVGGTAGLIGSRVGIMADAGTPNAKTTKGAMVKSATVTAAEHIAAVVTDMFIPEEEKE